MDTTPASASLKDMLAESADLANQIVKTLEQDAAFIEDRLAEAKRLDAAAVDKTEAAAAARLEAGRRLIEVRRSFLQDSVVSCKKPGRPSNGRKEFEAWLTAHEVCPPRTAYHLMKRAGFTEAKRKQATAKDTERKRTERAVKAAPAPKTTYTWGEALRTFGGFAGHLNSEKRLRLEKEYGELPEGEMDEPTARMWAARGMALLSEPPRVTRADLTPKELSKLERAIAQTEKDWMKRFHELVAQQVKKDLVECRKTLADAEAQHRREAARYAALTAPLSSVMTLEDFRLIRSVLHTDRDADPARKHRAYLAFTALEKHLVK